MNNDIALWQRRLERERRARKEAESLLEQKSLELYQSNQSLRAEIDERIRTEEQLKQSHQELQRSHQSLEQTQAQLLQSEKMASIGQLAAGVAHEINNPVGYVHSNLASLNRYLEDLFTVLDIYEQAEQAVADPELRQRLQRARVEADLAFLKEDVLALLNESREGLERVRRIVMDLKGFSHHSQAEEWEQADLHGILDATFNIVWNELKYKAEVVRDYADLPPVQCMPSRLNQVFVNLLVNAAHAIDKRGTITVRTGHCRERVWVAVSDTGHGINQEHLSRVFEPFFTTKPVGQGTGLGLSVSYGIVEKHHGHIDVSSSPGKGTTFTIWLPVSQQVAEAMDAEASSA